jgi:hypothetical protein
MGMLSVLLDLAGGRVPEDAEADPARRLRLVAMAALATALFGAMYGLAVGSTDLGLALANTWKLPMVLLLAAMCALPAGLVAHRLVGSTVHPVDMLLGAAAGNLTAALVLATASPLIALYYQSSESFGGLLSMGVGLLALVAGVPAGVRAVVRRAGDELRGAKIGLPVAVLVVLELLALVQLLHVASPILPEATWLDLGIDGVIGW